MTDEGSCDIDLQHVIVLSRQNQHLSPPAAVKHLADSEGFATGQGGAAHLLSRAQGVHAAPATDAGRVCRMVIQQREAVLLQTAVCEQGAT